MSAAKEKARARAEERRALRERLAELRRKLREALATRKARMKELQAEFRAKRLELRDRLQAERLRRKADLRESLRKEREAARTACAAQKAQARREATDAVTRARAELAAERKRQAEERRLAREHRKRHVAHDKQAEVDARSSAVMGRAVLGGFGPLFEVVGRSVTPKPGETRAEAVLRHVEKHPDVAHAVLEPAAERRIEGLKTEIAAAERTMNAPKPHEIAQDARRARRGARATPAAPSRPANDTASLSFDAALARFMTLAQKQLDDHRETKFPTLTREVLTAQRGPRYVRIVKGPEDGGVGSSAYCFIDRTNGDVRKPHGWKGPAKWARGNIYGSDPIAGVGPYGVAYVR